MLLMQCLTGFLMVVKPKTYRVKRSQFARKAKGSNCDYPFGTDITGFVKIKIQYEYNDFLLTVLYCIIKIDHEYVKNACTLSKTEINTL